MSRRQRHYTVLSPLTVLRAATAEQRLARLEAAERACRIGVRAGYTPQSGTIEGLAAPFDSNSLPIRDGAGWFVERFAPGAFAKSIAEAESGAADIFATWDHGRCICGSTAARSLRLREAADGLRFGHCVSLKFGRR